ncbi:hypothetical protein KEM55_002162 [Ascosphaera atra]|nr:hypothetical protein KEM55_002162 [Ascosphaera atra]
MDKEDPKPKACMDKHDSGSGGTGDGDRAGRDDAQTTAARRVAMQRQQFDGPSDGGYYYRETIPETGMPVPYLPPPLPAAPRAREFAGMSVTQIIEMVSGMLTKITTTNDSLHGAIHKHLTTPLPYREPLPPGSKRPEGIPVDPAICYYSDFHGRNIPGISIMQYLFRIHRYCPTSYEVYLSLLIYFDRMSAKVNKPYLTKIKKRDKARERARRRGELESFHSSANPQGTRRQQDMAQPPHAPQSPSRQQSQSAPPTQAPQAQSQGYSQPQVPLSSRNFVTRPLRPTPGQAAGDVYHHSAHPGPTSGADDPELNFPPRQISSFEQDYTSDSSITSDEEDSTSPGQPYYDPAYYRYEEEVTLSHTFFIDSYNIHRLVIAGVTCASKFFSDVFYTNSRYAKVGGLPLEELNRLELEFLFLNDFRLGITVEELDAYAEMLHNFYQKELRAQQQQREQEAHEERHRLSEAQRQGQHHSQPPAPGTNDTATPEPTSRVAPHNRSVSEGSAASESSNVYMRCIAKAKEDKQNGKKPPDSEKK